MTDKNFAGPEGFRLKPLLPADGEAHILFLKRGLNRLGYYTPDKRTGMTPEVDQGFTDALYAFQRKATIFFNDTEIGRDSTTERILIQELSRHNHNRYIWHTVGDDKVRGDHAAREGQIFSWDHPPEGGNPGEDYNCRCWAEPINPVYHPWKGWAKEKQEERILAEPGVDAIEPTYVIEITLLSLLGVGTIGLAWKAYAQAKKKNLEWMLSRSKSDTRWANQLKNRNWTPNDITKTLKYGEKFRAPNDINKGNTATRYEYQKRYLVRDDQTKEILQLGKEDFKRPPIPEE